MHPCGHITPSAVCPVSCAAGLAASKVLLNEKIVKSIKEGKTELLWHERINSVHSGLLIAVEFDSFEFTKRMYSLAKLPIGFYLHHIASGLRLHGKREIRRVCSIPIVLFPRLTYHHSGHSRNLKTKPSQMNYSPVKIVALNTEVFG
jgi:hypothetical protein